MRRRTVSVGIGGLVAVFIGVLVGRDLSLPQIHAQAKRAAAGEAGRAADRAAIEKSSADFAQAFAKGDAKACAAFWTDDGEYQDEDVAVRGRAKIEQLFAEFFKDKAKTKVQVEIESIHFPARDLAIEEGLLRQEGAGRDLPNSSRYSTIHVRE